MSFKLPVYISRLSECGAPSMLELLWSQGAGCCSPLLVRLCLVALSCTLMMAFVKPAARLFQGSAVNRQIPHPRLEMFSASCRAAVCSVGRTQERGGGGRKSDERREKRGRQMAKVRDVERSQQ